MGALLRSEEMSMVQLFIQYEAAHDTVDELGVLGAVQFTDLKHDVNSFQRSFVSEVKRADELERKLRYFEEQILKDSGLPADEQHPRSLAGASLNLDQDQRYEEYEARFEDVERDLLQLINNSQQLTRNQAELIELRHVLEKDAAFFGSGEMADAEVPADDDVQQPLLGRGAPGGGASRAVHLGFLTGVLARDKVANFERVLWRATRGNMFLKQVEILEPLTDPQTGEQVQKNVFVIFYQGESVQQKVKKICESFGANLYPVKQKLSDRQAMLQQVKAQLFDLQIVLARTAEQKKRLLAEVNTHLDAWKMKVAKEKAIYHTLNMFDYDVGRKCLIAVGWCPNKSLADVQQALRRASQRSGAQIPSILSIIAADEEPPTYFVLNKFTGSYQAMIEAYGVARYGEVNPAAFAIVTFPFLFGVMFGDVGHGIMLFLFSLFLVLNEQKLARTRLQEMVKTLFDGRYLLLLMSLFGIYAGFMYNEVFSIPMNFGSVWSLNTSNNNWVMGNSTYLFGVDPAWKGSEYELTFYNSLKMKMSIIFGVSQMTLGIVLSAFNGLHWRKPYDVLFEFIPQLLFMTCLFGYMSFLIVVKWLTPSTYYPGGSNGAPLIMNVMINMFLHFNADPLPDAPLYSGQRYVQPVLVVIALLCVPIMLLVKPLLLLRDHKRTLAHQPIPDHDHDNDRLSLLQHEDPERQEPIQAPVPAAKPAGQAAAHGGEHGEHGEFEFSEVIVHQVIHTIEFVLGAISNTASYLRLWALSLAHSELSYVFWALILLKSMKLLTRLGPVQFVALVATWAVWACATLSVLLIMESLSAFLHALRLHWVEFMNKFYRGDGRKFRPFSYEALWNEEA